jgi:hypothetical protein
MSRRSSRIVGVVAGVSFVALSSSSCVANDASILILGILAPPTSTTAGAACGYTANIDGPYLSYGVMDVGLSGSGEYIPEILVGNDLVPQGNAALDRIETNDVNLNGAIVRITDSSGAQLDNFTVLAAGFVFPASGGTPGLTPYAVTIISPKASAAVLQDLGGNRGTKTLVAYVKIFGTTTGGTHVESGEVSIPVNVCNGCLVNFPAGSDDPAQPEPNCLASATTGGTTISSPCVNGQDQFTDCRTCQGNPVCAP